MESLRKDIDNVMDDAYKLGVSNSTVACAYFLEAIAKMMYMNTFHEEYKRDYEKSYEPSEEVENEISESVNI